ncbi:hypothetical protein PL371_16385 [Tenacibaculum maritimum]|nr:hypothetical protein [Tenacibaculum maritimum]MDB0613409.1 hypothetical protein [Tenacibaculum maritimum]
MSYLFVFLFLNILFNIVSGRVNLPNNGGTFIYQMNSSGNTIMLIFKFILHKRRFSNNEYFYLKEFYKQLIDKQNEYIELERI